MALFYYKGKSLAGDTIQGIYEAENSSEVAEMLKRNGYFPAVIKEEHKKSLLRSLWDNIFKVGLKDMAVFCRQFATMVEAGIPVIECLATLEEQTTSSRLKRTIKSMVRDIRRGFTIAESCRNYPEVFPEMLVYMLEAGEITGHLDEVLKKMAAHFENLSKQREKIKSAMNYPIILSAVAFLVVSFLVTNVLPIFADLFRQSGAELPPLTRLLLTISANIGKIFIYFLVFLAFIILMYRGYRAKPEGAYKIDYIKLSVPIFGPLQKKIVAANFCRILAILISSGIPLLRSLEVAERALGNHVFKRTLEKARGNLRNGRGFAEALGSDVFPLMMVKMIRVGEEAGSLEEMLYKAAAFYETEIEIAQERLLSLIEPAMIIVMALIIGFIVVSIVIPMFSIYNLY